MKALSVENDLKRHLWLALALCVGVFGGVFVWASLFEISGAVVAEGSVGVQGEVKTIQHQEGGRVSRILVSEGDVVRSGAILMRLDGTNVRVELASVEKQLVEWTYKADRLHAELEGLEQIRFSDVLSGVFSKDQREEIQQDNIALMVARQKAVDGKEGQLREQIRQIEKRAEGLEVQREAKARELALVEEDIEANGKLRKKELVTRSAFNALRREAADAEGELGALVSEIAQARQTIGERQFALIEMQEEFRSSQLEELREAKAKIDQLEEQQRSARDRMDQLDIRAPEDGVVQELVVHTIGAVISPGAVVMKVVPKSDELIIRAQLDPNEIDRVFVGQDVRIRFPSFDARTTPEIFGVVDVVSADRVDGKDKSFYEARISIGKDQEERLFGQSLVPGMPAESYLQTGSRTILSYLFKPLSDQIEHVMRER